MKVMNIGMQGNFNKYSVIKNGAVIEKAQITCSQSNNNINYNFGLDTKIVKTGISSKFILDYKLSRYACYLIVQNANPKYETVALG